MKKFLAVATGVLLIGTCALTACNKDKGNETDGEIKGQYTEVTTAELQEKLSTLTPEKLFGDTSAKNWNFGVKLKADVDIDADIKTTVGEEKKTYLSGKIDDETTLLARLTVADGETALGNFSIKARNNNKIKGELKKSEVLGIEEDIKFDYGINAYADDQNLYFQLPDMKELPVEIIPEGKYKVPIDFLASYIAGFIPSAMTSVAETDKSDETADFLAEYGLKAAVDDSNGLKIKVSADKQTLYTVLEKTAGLQKTKVDELVQLNKFAINMYFEAAEDGAFEKAGLTVNIEGTLSIKAGDFDGLPALSGPVDIEADILVEKYDGEIIMPTAEELEEYQDLFGEDNGGNE